MSHRPPGWPESLDPSNPLVPRLVFGRGAGGRRNWRDSVPLIALWTLPIVAVLWAAGMWLARLRDPEPGAGELLRFAADASNYLLLLAAFGAPAAGVGARFRVDRSPLLADLLLSGLGWRPIAAAMHGRILAGTLFAFALALMVGAFMSWAILDPVQSVTQAINSSRLALVTGFVPLLRVGRVLGGSETVAALLMIGAMVANFAAGFHARASLNAAVGAVGPSPVVLTSVLVLSSMASFVVRWKAPAMLLAWSGSACPAFALFLLHAGIEGGCAAIRLGAAAWAWGRILRLGEAQCRSRLGWD